MAQTKVFTEEELIQMVGDAVLNRPLAKNASALEKRIRKQVAEIKRLGGIVDIPANIA